MMEIDLKEFEPLDVKVVAKTDKTIYKNTDAVILYEEGSRILSVRKLKRKIADQYTLDEELENFMFESKSDAVQFAQMFVNMSAIDYLLLDNKEKRAKKRKLLMNKIVVQRLPFGGLFYCRDKNECSIMNTTIVRISERS